MSRASTIKDLTAAIKKVEQLKRDLDKRLESLHIALRFFEDMSEETESDSYAKEIRNNIHDILVEERPQHRTTIYERLQERGVHVSGQDPINNVGAHLSVDTRFKNVDRGTWDLSESPVREQPKDLPNIDSERDNVVRLPKQLDKNEDSNEDVPW